MIENIYGAIDYAGRSSKLWTEFGGGTPGRPIWRQRKRMREACTASEAVGCRGEVAGEKSRRQDHEDLASAKLWVKRGEGSQTALARKWVGGRGCAIL